MTTNVVHDGEWRGPLFRAQVVPSTAVPGLNRIVFEREPALPLFRHRDALPVSVPFVPAPPASPSRLPASSPDARLVGRRQLQPLPEYLIPWVVDGPLPTADELRALRQKAGLPQREAAMGAEVSRGMVAQLERPRPRQTTLKVPRPESVRYVAWLRWQAAQVEADGVQQ